MLRGWAKWRHARRRVPHALTAARHEAGGKRRFSRRLLCYLCPRPMTTTGGMQLLSYRRQSIVWQLFMFVTLAPHDLMWLSLGKVTLSHGKAKFTHTLESVRLHTKVGTGAPPKNWHTYVCVKIKTTKIISVKKNQDFNITDFLWKRQLSRNLQWQIMGMEYNPTK